MVINVSPVPSVSIVLTMQVNNDGTPVVNASTMNFGPGFTVTTDGYGTAIVNANSATQYVFLADQLDSPVNSDWKVNALAPTSTDATNNALIIRQFVDASETGVGFVLNIPTGALNILLTIVARPATAPGSTQAVVLELYNRQITINAAVAAWSSGNQLTTLSIPTNAFFQTYSQTISLATLGVTAGTTTQFELTRLGANGSDTLTATWNLLSVTIGFS